jgi:hypothetical protein
MARIALGTDDFKKLREIRALYVDKTETIATLLQNSTEVSLFCRPRRFGKTLFLSTLRYFVEQSSEDSSNLYSDLEIWRREEARSHFQRYPVIWLSLKEVKAASWGEAWDLLRHELINTCMALSSLEEDPRLSRRERSWLTHWLDGSATPTQAKNLLKDLSALLHRVYGQRVIILIDEYDTPIHSAWVGGYYEKMVGFFRAFFGAGLKGNPSLHKAVLTGILRVAREGMFSSLNNLDVNSILDVTYAEAFGFTEAEVSWLHTQCQSPHSLATLKDWYNGYQIGGQTVYNPWSILACLARPLDPPGPYWVNTGSTDSLGDQLFQGDRSFLVDLQALLQGEVLARHIPEAMPLPGMGVAELRGMLLHAGYYTARSLKRLESGWEAGIAVPNRDVRAALTGLVARWLNQVQPDETSVRLLLTALLQGHVERFEKLLEELVIRALSFHDLANPDPERVYHAFVLGLLVLLAESHRVWSNLESGDGRADVLIIPRQSGGIGVVLEFKRMESVADLARGTEVALEQVEAERYPVKLVEAGAGVIRVYGIAFCGKKLKIKAA